jgi:hypothetical protein
MADSKMIRSIIVICSIGLLFGASFSSSIGSTKPLSYPSTPLTIDSTIATLVVQAKIKELHKSDVTIADSLMKESNDGSPLFFLFLLNPRGYLVISGSYDLPPVIAYSFTSTYPTTPQSTPLSEMLSNDLELRLQNIDHLPEEMIQQRHAEWDTYLEGQSQRSDQFEQWPPEGTTPTGGWLLTDWTQSAPYNNLCPLDLANGGARSIAGCPAVAMAQIMNYHNTTNDVAFNDDDDYYHNFAGNQYWIDNDHVMYDFPSFPTLNNYLSSLQNHYENHQPPTNTEKAAITFACGVAAHQVYSASVSGTYGVAQAYQAYQRFNCSTVSLLQASNPNLYGLMAHDMMDALPDHLAVVDPGWQYGHNLVIDGYNTDNYYHLNFGWGGSYDGWYLIPDEIPYGLTVIEGVIVDILQPNMGVPDLSGTGNLAWVNVTPGNTATGSFTLSNIGDAGSDLAWKVIAWPSWGTWAFAPSYGHNLTPEDGPLLVNVSVIAPNKQNQQYTGEIKIVNIEDSTDYCTIPVSLQTNEGVKADLSCSGSLTWTEVHPGALMNGSFTVRNIGSASSNLSWEVASWPEWGAWTFTPSQGDHLTPEEGPITINVSVYAPDKKHTEFTGVIYIVNKENSSDNGTIPVSLTTPYIPDRIFIDFLRFLTDRFPAAFPFLRHLLNF